jgi:AcrR family transcriptional regulator
MAPTPDTPAGPPLDARVVRTRNDILRTAVQVLVEQGLDAVTHPHLAQAAGYSRATLYNHWPTRNALLRDAFLLRGSGEHSTPSGDLRADLIAELTKFRSEMEQYRIQNALAVLVTLTTTDPELADVRDKLVADGERVLRQLLGPILDGPALEAAVLMLSGAILNSALFHGELPSDSVIAATVDLVLCTLNRDQPGSSVAPED